MDLVEAVTADVLVGSRGAGHHVEKEKMPVVMEADEMGQPSWKRDGSPCGTHTVQGLQSDCSQAGEGVDEGLGASNPAWWRGVLAWIKAVRGDCSFGVGNCRLASTWSKNPAEREAAEGQEESRSISRGNRPVD